MRIGIMGGTFDPIHIAHLVAASCVFEELNLDQILFIPAGNPWQKAQEEVVAGQTRLQMVDLAIAGDPRFISSDIEIESTGPTYSINTVKALLAENPNNEYFWIIGSDALVTMPTWHDFAQLKDLIRIVAVNRNGIFSAEVDFAYQFVEIPEIRISSTEIRNRVSQNKSIKYLVSPSVELFIRDLGLYRK